MTCAVECRTMYRPASLATATGATPSPGGGRVRQIAQLAVDPGGDDLRVGAERLARRRASLDHMLATCEGDTKLLAGHGGLLHGRNNWPKQLVTRCYRGADVSRARVWPRLAAAATIVATLGH